MINPLETNQQLPITLANPNPKAKVLKDGPKYTVEFELTRDDWDLFTDPNIDLTGMVLDAVMQVSHRNTGKGAQKPLEPKKETTTKHPYGAQANTLRKSGFFYVPQVQAALGTDEDFRSWVATQKCIISGDFDYPEGETGEGCIETTTACHVLRADQAPSRQGDHPNKPAYSCVPMLQKYHSMQHQNGELEVYVIHLQLKGKYDQAKSYDPAEAKAWFEAERDEAVLNWGWQALKLKSKYNSMGDIPPVSIRQWAQLHDIERFLPKCYKEAEEEK